MVNDNTQKSGGGKDNEPSLNDIAESVAWDKKNWSNPITHDWSCHRVMVDVFEKWDIPIGPIASYDPKEYYDKFWKATEGGKHSAIFSDDKNTLRVTLIDDPVNAQIRANNAQKGKSIEITLRTGGIGHVQIVVPDISR